MPPDVNPLVWHRHSCLCTQAQHSSYFLFFFAFFFLPLDDAGDDFGAP
jgi:hypothetical protein